MVLSSSPHKLRYLCNPPIAGGKITRFFHQALKFWSNLMTSNSDPQVPKDVAGSPSSTEVTEVTSPATTVPEDSLVLWIFCVILCSCPMSTLCFRSVPPPLCRTHLLPWIPWSRLWLCLRKGKPIQLLFLGTMVMWTPHRHLGMNPVCKDFKNSLLHKADGNIFLFFVLVPCFTKYSQQSRKGDHPTCLIRGGCRWWPFRSACFGFWWGHSGENQWMEITLEGRVGDEMTKVIHQCKVRDKVTELIHQRDLGQRRNESSHVGKLCGFYQYFCICLTSRAWVWQHLHRSETSSGLK